MQLELGAVAAAAAAAAGGALKLQEKWAVGDQLYLPIDGAKDVSTTAP